MATNQIVRVIRRKLIDRVKTTQVCTGGVRGYEAGAAPGRGGELHGIVTVADGGRVAGATLTAVHLYQPFTIHVLKALPLGSAEDAQAEQLDPVLTDARDTILAALLAPVVYGDGIEIDPAGHSAGAPATMDAGYLPWDDTHYRTATITVGWIAWNAMETTR